MSTPVRTKVGMEFHRPQNLDELYSVLGDAPEDCLLLAGGMTAMPYINRGEWTSSCVISLSAVPEMAGVHLTSSNLVIGASTTHTELTEDPLVRTYCPVLVESAAAVGDLQVRNRGTIGGTVAFANSGADHVTTLTALNAAVVLSSTTGVRRVLMRDFVIGRRRTIRTRHEIITALEVPLDASRIARYLRLTRVQGASPVLTLVAARGADGHVLCIGGATARPILLYADLLGMDESEIRNRVLEAVVDPIGDSWSPPHYRRAMAAEHAVRVLTLLHAALPQREEGQ
ncbi:FAD binding domain-containing protein (plasmid) [Rhodococcus globerulus]|uniref:FAD binding domain-containing protein n=1 Tax=Rhodococcus globerulus TaxID=33008 RepID=UPI0039E99836